MTPTLHPVAHRPISPRSASRRPDIELLNDAELRSLKRELAAAKQRFLDLALDAEHARTAAAQTEHQVRARLHSAVEILSHARAGMDGPPISAAVDSALSALRSLAASLPPPAPPAN